MHRILHLGPLEGCAACRQTQCCSLRAARLSGSAIRDVGIPHSRLGRCAHRRRHPHNCRRFWNSGFVICETAVAFGRLGSQNAKLSLPLDVGVRSGALVPRSTPELQWHQRNLSFVDRETQSVLCVPWWSLTVWGRLISRFVVQFFGSSKSTARM